jgi:TolB-like protein/Tfp pilus assembly protein PilF
VTGGFWQHKKRGDALSFIEELKRRNVVRVGIAYVVTAWLLLQLADIVVDNIPAPDWAMQTIMLVLAGGLPIVLIFAWAFEMTPEGLKKEKDVDRSQSITPQTGRKLDRAIIVILVLALGYFVWDKVSSPGAAPDPEVASEESVTGDSGPLAKDDPAPATQDIPEKSIAVLPFVNMSSDEDQVYFSDGISEELLNVLAKYPGVQVAARTSSFQFKGQNRDIGEIARLLKVRHVLEGSVRKAGNKVRITAQLIEAESGYHLWSETYDREIDDIFAIQDEISLAIGEAMRVELALGGDGQMVPRVAESANTAAYEAFLQGRHLVNQRGRRNIFAARDHLERSVRLDPDYAPAHAWLSIAHSLLLASPSTYGDYTTEEMISRSQPHADRAMELDPELAEAHGALGLLAMNAPDLDLAMQELTLALELNPVYVDAMTWYMLTAQALGDWQDAYDMSRRTMEVDPLSVVGRMNHAGLLSLSDLPAARQVSMSIIDQNPWAGYTSRGVIELYSTSDISLAVEWLLKAYSEDPADEFSNQSLMFAFSTIGEFDEARRISDRGHFFIDVEQGDLESALFGAQSDLDNDPQSMSMILSFADILYRNAQFEQAIEYYDRVMQQVPAGRIMLSTGDLTTRSMLRYAYTLKQAGDEQGAQKLVKLHQDDYVKKVAANYASSYDHAAEAMARAMRGDVDGVFEYMELAIDRGFRQKSSFSEPVFESVRSHPDFQALQFQMAQLMEAEQKETLQLICHENPVPHIWQPMRKTCMGVAARAKSPAG